MRRGCVRGVLVAVAVCVVGAALGWSLIGRPYVRDAARDDLRHDIAAQVTTVATLPVRSTGELVLTEAKLNADLRANGDTYGPVTDPRLIINADGVRLTFSVFGTDNAFSGRPAIVDGRLVIVDGDLEGPAAQILTPGDAADLVAEQLATLLARSRLRPTGVRLAPGVLTITTAPA
jgi:hypothetical protein